MEQLDDIYKALGYSEERKVPFDAFRLKGPVRDWWLRIRGEWEREREVSNWGNFVEAFKSEFIPQWIREQMEEELQTLKQGSMAMSQC